MKKLLSSVFTRLIFYFLLVMCIPFMVFFLSAFSSSDRNIMHAIEKQAATSIEMDAETIEGILEEYRHKAYVLSQLPEVKKAVSNRKTGEDLYSSLFLTMHGDLDLAAAHIISIDGQLRVSTHAFPSRYDFRIHSSVFEDDSIIGRTADLENPNKSVIAMLDHQSDENNRLILASIARQILNDRGDLLGFVIIDIYTDVLNGRINTSGLFNEEVLISQDDYMAFSLLHPTKYGSYEKFPLLTAKDAVRSGTLIESGQFRLVGMTDTEPYMTSMSEWLKFFTFALVLGLVISIALSLIFSHSVSKRIKRISEKMKEVEEGNLDITLEPSGLREIDALSSSFNMMVKRISRLLDLTREEEAKLAEAEKKQLESQLNPHFLFNTLNTIKALARINGEAEIYTISVKLGKLLRSSLSSHTSLVTIRESLELTESYLMIQQIRFKDKIDYAIDADPELLDVMTPKLIIQPFADNAVVHGLEPMTTSGRVDITVRKADDDRMEIRISDNGIGFDSALMKEQFEKLEQSEHVGVWNTYRRLKMHYGEELGFDIESRPGEGTAVTITLPIREEKKD